MAVLPAQQTLYPALSLNERPSDIDICIMCRNSKAPFNFVLNLMVPGPQKLALVITWAAEQNPSLSHQNSGSSAPSLQRDHSSVSSHADSDSEAGSGPFDILLARSDCPQNVLSSGPEICTVQLEAPFHHH